MMAGGPEVTERWTAADVPDQHGRTAVVTGADGGLGFEVARVLAERGALVLLACRDLDRAGAAAARIGGEVDTLRLDLASLASVREAAGRLRADHPRLDLLVNNAGVMAPPHRRSADGFELQFGTNHLGHFALTGLILDTLLAVPGSRIVTVSSNGHRIGRIRFDDLHFERGYRRWAAYGQSKLANLLFTYELQRRLGAAGAKTVALAAHPGTASTRLQRHLPRWTRVVERALPHQDARHGSLAVLRAAADPDARGGEYYGPGGPLEFTGPPVRVRSSARSHDVAVGRRLWLESERLTGVTYPV